MMSSGLVSCSPNLVKPNCARRAWACVRSHRMPLSVTGQRQARGLPLFGVSRRYPFQAHCSEVAPLFPAELYSVPPPGSRVYPPSVLAGSGSQSASTACVVPGQDRLLGRACRMEEVTVPALSVFCSRVSGEEGD